MTAAIAFAGDAPRIAIERRTLACGLDVILHRDDTAPQVCANICYRVGSSDERPDRTSHERLLLRRPR